MSDQQPEPEQRFEIEIAPDVEPGVHADFVTMWHTADTFVLDFAALRRPPELAEDEAGNRKVVLPTRIVSRVKLPPGQVFELMKILERQLSAWEIETGQRPGSEPGSTGG